MLLCLLCQYDASTASCSPSFPLQAPSGCFGLVICSLTSFFLWTCCGGACSPALPSLCVPQPRASLSCNPQTRKKQASSSLSRSCLAKGRNESPRQSARKANSSPATPLATSATAPSPPMRSPMVVWGKCTSVCCQPPQRQGLFSFFLLELNLNSLCWVVGSCMLLCMHCVPPLNVTPSAVNPKTSLLAHITYWVHVLVCNKEIPEWSRNEFESSSVI